MEIKEIEVVKKEKIYTFTESELKDLRCKEREYGSTKTREYIIFCYRNYIWKMNVGGIVSFIGDLFDFLTYKKDSIPNHYEYSLHEWRSRYE